MGLPRTANGRRRALERLLGALALLAACSGHPSPSFDELADSLAPRARWPVLAEDVRVNVDLSAGTSSPASVRLQFLPEVGTEERVTRPSGGSSAVVSLENPGASPLTVQVSSTRGRVKLETSCRGLAPQPNGSLAGDVPSGGTTCFRATAVAVGAPQVVGDVISIQTASGSVGLPLWIEPLVGEWRGAGPNGAALNLGMVGVHAALLRYGDEGGVLFYSPPRERDKNGQLKIRPNNNPIGGGYFWNLRALNDVEIAFLDLNTNQVAPRSMGEPRNLFCSGHAHLPDGRLLVVGGHTRGAIGFIPIGHNADTLHVFDPAGPASGSWTRLPVHLPETRWYPTVTALPDGRMLIVSGRGAPLLGDWHDFFLGWYRTARRTYEIFDATTGNLVSPPKPQNTFIDDAELATYPAVLVLPGGTKYPNGVLLAQERCYGWLFEYGSSGAPLARASKRYEMLGKGSRSYPYYGSAALLPFEADADRFRLLIVGGQHEDNADDRDYRHDQVPTRTAEIFDFDNTADLASQSGWRRVMPLGESRVLPTATHLADGTVLVTGGAALGWANCNSGNVLAAELFDPKDESFHRMASARIERRYHSTALLLPDATLLSAGSTGGFNLSNDCIDPQFVAERFYPPYLWRGPRPILTAMTPSSGEVSLGQSFDLEVSSEAPDGMRVALVRLASVTHGNNMDQRFVWLKSVRSGSCWAVDAPSRGDIAPPGDYLLFLVDGLGVPSKATFVRLK